LGAAGGRDRNELILKKRGVMRKAYGFLAISALILAACGRTSSTSATQPSEPAQPAPAPEAAALDPCSAATKADVEQLLGKPVSEGKPNEINKSICDFKVGEMGAGVSFMLVPRGPTDSVATMVAEMGKRNVKVERLAGFDEAYRLDASYGMRQAGAFKGTKHVIVTVAIPAMPADQAQAVAEQALRKALDRL
jgi:hypothetical protein